MRKGISVSPGVAVGKAYCIHQVFVGEQAPLSSDDEVTREVDRFERARQGAADALKARYEKVAAQVGRKEAAIFQVHEAILHDPAFLAKVRECICGQRLASEVALQRVLAEYTALFTRIKDEYLRERLSDVRDVIVEISGHLSKVLKPEEGPVSGPLILIADELLPSHVMTLGEREIAGLVTETGGRTSHAAILARGRGIPAVTGLDDLLRQVKNGDTVIVDGRDGHVIINPNVETESAYRKLQREFRDLKGQLAENRDQSAVSADGELVELLANINHVLDAKATGAMGGSGVGLFRTEYLFLGHPDVPNEQEQIDAYRQIIANSPDGRVTIRTLDLGGDKTIPYLGPHGEANPFLGWRSIRLSFEYPEFFATQIRAVLAAAAQSKCADGRVRILFPMITTLEEMRRVRMMVRRARLDLQKRKMKLVDVPIGLMVEVPAAAVSIDTLLEVVDFVSIGSNDLVQYLMAADRDNPKVNHLCQPLAPPVLRVLHGVIQACNRAKKHVCVCGEMAGSPRAYLLLFGMGLRSFSMSPAFIPTIKKVASRLSQAKAEQILAAALKLKTTLQVHRYVGKQIAELCPDLQLLDSA